MAERPNLREAGLSQARKGWVAATRRALWRKSAGLDFNDPLRLHRWLSRGPLCPVALSCECSRCQVGEAGQAGALAGAWAVPAVDLRL